MTEANWSLIKKKTVFFSKNPFLNFPELFQYFSYIWLTAKKIALALL